MFLQVLDGRHHFGHFRGVVRGAGAEMNGSNRGVFLHLGLLIEFDEFQPKKLTPLFCAQTLA